MLSLNWFDWLLLVAVVASAAASLFRGFVAEALSLVGWVLAFIAATVLYPDLAGAFAPLVPSWNHVPLSAFAGLIAFMLGICLLINRRLSGFIGSPGLSLGDRLSASILGLMRGGIVGAVIVSALAFTSVTAAPWWQNSQLTGVILSPPR